MRPWPSFSSTRVSLPGSVVDAPQLIEMLPAQAMLFFLLEFQSRMLLPPEVAAAIQLVATTTRDGCAVRGHPLALSVKR